MTKFQYIIVFVTIIMATTDCKAENKQITNISNEIKSCLNKAPSSEFINYFSCIRLYEKRAEMYLKLNLVEKAISDFTIVCNSNYEEVKYPKPVFDCSKLNSLNKVKLLGSNWVYLTESNGTRYFFDKSYVKKISNGIYKVMYLTETIPKNIINELRDAGFPTDGYENYSHSVDIMEFNCNQKTSAFISKIEYSSNGKVISTLKFDQFGDKQKFNEIMPNSIGEELYNKVCKFKKNKKSI